MSRTLLAIFAHPDDETFGPGGTLARYAAEGVDVHLVCATRGGVGVSDLDDLGECQDLACLREKELRCAADVLGLAGLHLLDYCDSGMAGSPANQHPRALVQADAGELATKVAAVIRSLCPQVVMTFDPYGAYGHPDHIAIHRATVTAFEHLSGLPLPKLYYTTLPYAALRWVVRLMPLFGTDPQAVGKNRDIDLRAALAHEIPITTRIDVRATYDVRLRASACHSSQLSGPASLWGRLPPWLTRHWRSAETFHRALPPFQEKERLERDLFAGTGRQTCPPWVKRV